GHVRQAGRRPRPASGAADHPGPGRGAQAVQRDRAEICRTKRRLHPDPEARAAAGRRRAHGPDRTPARGVGLGAIVPGSVIRLLLAYDGTGFRGWARQPGVRTVQGVIEDALEPILGRLPRLSVAGRTDAGVHAWGQVASFVAPADLQAERVQRMLNGVLAPEVVVREA